MLPPAAGFASSTTTVITAFTGDGWLTWSNAVSGGTCTIERADHLVGSNVWASHFLRPVTSHVMRCNVFRPPPPEGMVFIPGGSNSGTNPLGTGESYSSCFYPETYTLTVGWFYMDRYEVTKALWDEVRDDPQTVARGYTDLAVGGGKAADHPVQYVSWFDCVKWCNARSQKDGREPVYYTDAEYTQIYRAGQVLEPYVKASANGYRLRTATAAFPASATTSWVSGLSCPSARGAAGIGGNSPVEGTESRWCDGGNGPGYLSEQRMQNHDGALIGLTAVNTLEGEVVLQISRHEDRRCWTQSCPHASRSLLAAFAATGVANSLGPFLGTCGRCRHDAVETRAEGSVPENGVCGDQSRPVLSQ